MDNLIDYSKNFYRENILNFLDRLMIYLKLNSDKFLNILLYSILLLILYFLSKKIINRIIKISLNLKNITTSPERLITLSSVFNSILKLIFSFVFLILVLKEFDIKVIHIITGAGVVGAAIVYIFQNLIQDVIKGWILIFEDQMRKGEWVNVNNTFVGKIIEFNLRHLVLRDFDRNLIFIPNGQINTVVNLSRELKRNFLKVKFKRPDNLDEFINKVKEILNRLESEKVQNIKIHQINIGENFVEFVISFRCKFVLRDEIFNYIKMEMYRKFKDELIELT